MYKIYLIQGSAGVCGTEYSDLIWAETLKEAESDAQCLAEDHQDSYDNGEDEDWETELEYSLEEITPENFDQFYSVLEGASLLNSDFWRSWQKIYTSIPDIALNDAKQEIEGRLYNCKRTIEAKQAEIIRAQGLIKDLENQIAYLENKTPLQYLLE